MKLELADSPIVLVSCASQNAFGRKKCACQTVAVETTLRSEYLLSYENSIFCVIDNGSGGELEVFLKSIAKRTKDNIRRIFSVGWRLLVFCISHRQIFHLKLCLVSFFSWLDMCGFYFCIT